MATAPVTAAAVKAVCTSYFTASDDATRRSCEAQIEALGAYPGYGLALTQLLLAADEPVHLRQFAGSLLKRVVVGGHWSASTHKQGEPAQVLVSPAEKAAIRAALPQGLRDRRSKIRTAAGMAIASIGEFDWPKEWPTLFRDLVACLRLTTEPLLVHGAVRCLSFFVEKDCIGTDHSVELTSGIAADLLAIFASQSNNARLRSRAGSVMRSCLQLMAPLESEAAYTVVRSVYKPWIEACSVVLQDASLDAAACGLKTTALKVILTFLSQYTPVVKDVLKPVMGVVFTFMRAFTEKFEAHAVQGKALPADSSSDTAYDSDGDAMGLDIVAVELLAFCAIMASSMEKSYRSLLKANLKSVVYYTIGLMQITQDQAEDWFDDVDEFIAHDDNDAPDVTIRNSGQDLVGELLQSFGFPALAPICQAVLQRLQEAGVTVKAPASVADVPAVAASLGVPSATWQLQEACLVLVSRIDVALTRHEANLAADAADAKAGAAGGGAAGGAGAGAGAGAAGAAGSARRRSKGPLPLTSAALTPYLLAALQLQSSSSGGGAGGGAGTTAGDGVTFLVGRALVCASKLCQAFPQELCVPFMKAAVLGLQPSQPATVRVAATRSMNEFAPRVPQQVLESVLPQALGHMANLATTCGGLGLVLVLSTMGRCLKAGPTVAAAAEPGLTPPLVQLWQKYATNYQVAPTITEIFNVLVNLPACNEGLLSRLWPTVSAVIGSPPNKFEPGTIEAALELARGLVERAPVPLTAQLSSAFAVAVHLCGVAEGTTLQSACDLLASIIHKAHTSIAAAPPAEVSKLLAIVERLVGDLDDSSAQYGSEVIFAVLDKLQARLPAGAAQAILVAAVKRLAAARYPTLMQLWIKLFARLSFTSADGVIATLSAHSMPLEAIKAHTKWTPPAGTSSVNCLAVLLLIWNAYVSSFMGAFTRRLCFVALGKLLADPRVMKATATIQIDTDEPETSSSGRVLRSQKAAWKKRSLAVALGVTLAQGLLAGEDDGEAEWADDFDDDSEDDFDEAEDAEFAAQMAAAGISLGSGADYSSPFADAENYMFLSDGISDSLPAPFADGFGGAGTYGDEDIDEGDVTAGDAGHPLLEADTTRQLASWFASLAAAGAAGGDAAALGSKIVEALPAGERSALQEAVAKVQTK